MRIAWMGARALLLVLLVIVAVALIAGRDRLSGPEPGSGRAVDELPAGNYASRDARAPQAPSMAAASVHGESPAAPDASADYERELLSTEDRFEFARKLLVKAQDGDDAAQYFLAMTLSECETFDQVHFRSGDRRLTYDEAMQAAIDSGGLNWEYLAHIYKSCTRLVENTEVAFGSPVKWMDIASSNGNPRALATIAVQKANRGRYDPRTNRDPIIAEARLLAYQAAGSGDPAAIALVGEVAATLIPYDATGDPHGWVWLLAACQRGMDCSRQSAWYQFRCAFDPDCQPYEVGIVDVIRRNSGSDFADLERRATELNEKIDQGRVDELGF